MSISVRFMPEDRLGLLLRNRNIGLSISDNSDRVQFGFGRIHQSTFMYELARTLYRCGASISYGGHLDREGFTETSLQHLIDEQQTCQHLQRILSYVAWPLYCERAEHYQQLEKKLRANAEIIKLPAPDDFPEDPNRSVEFSHIPNCYYLFRSMTEMRLRMNSEIDARVVLGGKMTQFVGRFPGIFEEVLLAVATQKPVYICGGFGGAANALARLFADSEMVRAKRAVQDCATESFDELSPYRDDTYIACVGYYETMLAARLGGRLASITKFMRFTTFAVDYSVLFQFFREVGIAGLNNGLSIAENQALFFTRSLDEMRTLILTGLSRVPAGRSSLEQPSSAVTTAFTAAMSAPGLRSPLLMDDNTTGAHSADELLLLQGEVSRHVSGRYDEKVRSILCKIAPEIAIRHEKVPNEKSQLILDLHALNRIQFGGNSALVRFIGEIAENVSDVVQEPTVARMLGKSASTASSAAAMRREADSESMQSVGMRIEWPPSKDLQKRLCKRLKQFRTIDLQGIVDFMEDDSSSIDFRQPPAEVARVLVLWAVNLGPRCLRSMLEELLNEYTDDPDLIQVYAAIFPPGTDQNRT